MTRQLLLFISCLAASAANFGAGINFPTVRNCISPDLRWTIRCVTVEERDGYLHKLYLSRLAATKEEFVYASGRNCDVLWSADGERLAITDWSGSSTAEIYLVEVSEPRKLVPLHVKGVMGIVEKAELEGHCYYEALKWEASRRLLIRISGHTDENPSHGFAYYLSVDTSSGISKLVKKESREPDSERSISR